MLVFLENGNVVKVKSDEVMGLLSKNNSLRTDWWKITLNDKRQIINLSPSSDPELDQAIIKSKRMSEEPYQPTILEN